MGFEIQNPDPLKSKQKCLDFEWSSFQMVGTKAWPFENQTIWNPILKNIDFKCFDILNGQISDPYRIQLPSYPFA